MHNGAHTTKAKDVTRTNGRRRVDSIVVGHLGKTRAGRARTHRAWSGGTKARKWYLLSIVERGGQQKTNIPFNGLHKQRAGARRKTGPEPEESSNEAKAAGTYRSLCVSTGSK